MSRINGERSRANITHRRRSAQRVIDRALRVEMGVKPAEPAAAPIEKASSPAAAKA